jgi:serine/threonine-protein kinase
MSIPLDIPGRYLIGSQADAVVQLSPAEDLSPHHAILLLEPSILRIRDLDSRTGTFLNGKKIEDATLQDGDRIRCGSVTITVHLESPGPLTQTVTPTSAIAVVEDTENELPPIIKGYAELKQIGRGSLGTVYSAKQLGTNRQVAIKCIRPELESDERTRQLFIREASITAQLKHPRIVEYLGFGLAQDRPYLVMEYIPSENLETVVWRHAPARRVRLAVKVLLQVLESLAHAHAAGIVHRDIKPSNILANTASGRLFVKVSDFGLAKIFQTAGYSGITASNEICGTLAYMSPEQLMDSRSAKPESDVYSAVVCLYRLLTGEYPHREGMPAEIIHRRLNEPIRPVQSFNPEIPNDLARIVDCGLSQAPEMRYSSATALHAALGGLPLLRKS